MISPSREAEAESKDSQINLFKKLKTKWGKSKPGDQRTMDAADTLVSLAHSASSTPTIESKPFRPLDEIIEKTINLDEMASEQQNGSLIESACKILVEQVLKSCPNADLSSITIKASAKRSNEDAKRRKRAVDSDSDSESTRTGRSAPTLATGRRSRDLELPPDEARKRQERRERNKVAAARCRLRREQLAQTLSQKTTLLSQEQDQLNKNYQKLIKEKLEWERIFNEHVKSCVKETSDSSSSMPLTPISAKENCLNFFESSEKNKNGLTRPSNLNLKSTTLTTAGNFGNMATPSSATLNSMLQGIALALGQTNSPSSFSIGSNNNISFMMTPTFQLNTPTAFLSFTPIESHLGTLNTPIIIQSNPFLAVQDSTNKTGESEAKS